MTGKVRFQQRTRVAGSFVLFITFCVILSLSSPTAAAPNIGSPGVPDFLRDPVYRIPLRVHVGASGRSPEDFTAIIGEINDIWLPQAGICFEMQIVQDDKLLDQGMDIWFLPVLRGGSTLNGYFRDEHNIQVRDTPVLGPAAHHSASAANFRCLSTADKLSAPRSKPLRVRLVKTRIPSLLHVVLVPHGHRSGSLERHGYLLFS